jgi:regulator of replication initiation timing
MISEERLKEIKATVASVPELLAEVDQLRAENAELRTNNDRLARRLAVAWDYAEDRHDVLDGPDGPRPNEWMQLTSAMELA